MNKPVLNKFLIIINLGNWAYSYATRTYKDNQMVDTRTQIDRKEYAVSIYLIKRLKNMY